MNDDKRLDELIPHTTGCGTNADPADGFGYCTCGAEKQQTDLKQLIKEKEVEARKDQIMQDFMDLLVDTVDGQIDESALIDWRERQLDALQQKLKGRENG